MAKTHKSINFDLDTKLLEQEHPKRDATVAYKEIGRFLKKHGFDHRQGSGYISKKPMFDTDVKKLILQMQYKYPWLKKCSKKLDVTSIEEMFDMIPIIKSARLLGQKNNNLIVNVEGQMTFPSSVDEKSFEPFKHRTINFDLSTKELKKHHPHGAGREPYEEIRSFMEKNGFEHRQKSGYISAQPMLIADVAQKMKAASIKFPWLEKCVEVCDVTSVRSTFDLKKFLDNYLARHSQQQAQPSPTPVQNPSKGQASQTSDPVQETTGKQNTASKKRQQTATFTRAALKKEARRVHENAKNAPAPERKHKKNNQEH